MPNTVIVARWHKELFTEWEHVSRLHATHLQTLVRETEGLKRGIEVRGCECHQGPSRWPAGEERVAPRDRVLCPRPNGRARTGAQVLWPAGPELCP